MNTHIETLDLEGNHIESEGAFYLNRMLKDNSYITELVRDFVVITDVILVLNPCYYTDVILMLLY